MKKRNGTIELMRFVFSMIIVAYHINSRYWSGGYYFSESIGLCSSGYIGVEFFFLVSGYLMGASADRKNESGLPTRGGELGSETWSFLWRKIRGVLPYHLLFIVFTYAIKIIKDPGAVQTYVLDQLIPDLFFLGRTGLMAPTVNNEWYLTTMFFAILLLYPLCRKFGENFSALAAPVISVLTLGYLMQAAGTLGIARGWNGWIYQCTLRAIGEMSLGLVCYHVSRWLQRRSFSAGQRVLLTLLEVAGYLVAIWFSFTVGTGAYSYYPLLTLAAAITISFSCQSLTCRCPLLQNSVVLFLGKISLPIFLLQGVVANIVDMLVSWPARYQFLFACGMIVLVSALTYLVVERLERHWAAKKIAPSE